MKPSALTLPQDGDLGVIRRTAQEQVAETLRLAILGGRMPPGTPLVLSELADRMGVSATPVREAIRDLSAEGLVDFDSYKSAVVHVPPPGEAREVYELRLVLEPLAIRRAVTRISQEWLDRAQSLCQMMQQTKDIGLWVEHNREFHRLLTEPADSPRLLRIIKELRNVAALHVTQSLRSESGQIDRANADHERILADYRNGDVEQAVARSVEHLKSTLRIIEDSDKTTA